MFSPTTTFTALISLPIASFSPTTFITFWRRSILASTIYTQLTPTTITMVRTT